MTYELSSQGLQACRYWGWFVIPVELRDAVGTVLNKKKKLMFYCKHVILLPVESDGIPCGLVVFFMDNRLRLRKLDWDHLFFRMILNKLIVGMGVKIGKILSNIEIYKTYTVYKLLGLIETSPNLF